MSRRVVRPTLALLLAFAGACTTFGAVRSAEVRPGFSADVLASWSGSVGDVAGWFWSDECIYPCDTAVGGAGAAATYAWARRGPRPPLALSVGTSGLFPFVEGYAQLGAGRVPFGLGARVGIGEAREHSLFARVDLPLGPRARLLLDPALFVHESRSASSSDPRVTRRERNSFVAVAQGLGLEVDAGHVSFVPAVTIVRGRARHGGYGTTYGPEWSTFPVASLGASVGRRRR
ncbi:MAG TPA: hypothetical protein VEA99_01850 [Gemmatimonadaceae bacterium]|nr:hypothetical protein [Gemmatimonadaceae bacterium]